MWDDKGQNTEGERTLGTRNTLNERIHADYEERIRQIGTYVSTTCQRDLDYEWLSFMFADAQALRDPQGPSWGIRAAEAATALAAVFGGDRQPPGSDRDGRQKSTDTISGGNATDRSDAGMLLCDYDQL